MAQLCIGKKLLAAVLLLAVFAGVAEGAACIYLRKLNGDTGGTLAWFEDFRVSMTDKGLKQAAVNATINRIPVGLATGKWPSGITHVAENVYVAQMDATYSATNLWPQPAVGQYLFARMLLNNSLPSGASTGGDHGFETNVTNPLPWAWRVWGGDADSFPLEFTTWDDANGPNEFRVEAPKDVVLRLEWRAERTGAGTSQATLAVRVYNNETGALLGSHTGMINSTPAGGGQNPFREFIFGMSGQGGASFNGGSVYWGALAFRVSNDPNAWIGAYPVAGVER